MIFQCQLCEATFKQRLSLREHNQSVHEGIIYKCLICFVETYKAKKSVKRHLLQIHQIESPQIDVHYLSEKTDNPTEPGYPTRPLNGCGRIGKTLISIVYFFFLDYMYAILLQFRDYIHEKLNDLKFFLVKISNDYPIFSTKNKHFLSNDYQNLESTN